MSHEAVVHENEAVVHENRFAGAEMWFLSLATMVLAVGALLVIMWEPMALGIALGVGLLAIEFFGRDTRLPARLFAERVMPAFARA